MEHVVAGVLFAITLWASVRIVDGWNANNTPGFAIGLSALFTLLGVVAAETGAGAAGLLIVIPLLIGYVWTIQRHYDLTVLRTVGVLVAQVVLGIVLHGVCELALPSLA